METAGIPSTIKAKKQDFLKSEFQKFVIQSIWRIKMYYLKRNMWFIAVCLLKNQILLYYTN